METFQLLSGGGVRFNKTKYEKDVSLFTKAKYVTSRADTTSNEMPAELDFFKYARAGTGKRKQQGSSSEQPSEKRRRVNEEAAEKDIGDDLKELTDKKRPQERHRVTSKGNRIPEAVDTFEALYKKYGIPSHVYRNLSESGYNYPTSIQSHAVPVLLESRDLAAISPTGTGKTLAYLLPVMAALQAPITSIKDRTESGLRALIIVPTRELAHQIHNECLRLAQGRKWRIMLFSKATAATLADKNVKDKVDIIISTPLRLVASLQADTLDLRK